MERYNISINKIHNTSPFCYHEEDSSYIVALQAFIRKYGQYDDVVVARVNGLVFVVKGQLIYTALHRMQSETVWVKYLGELTEEEFLTAKLLFDVREVRLEYIMIAEAVSKICSTEQDCKRVSIQTNIPLQEVKRYKDLLTFNWAEFEKLSINTGNKDLFGEEITILNDYVTKKKMGKKHVENIALKNKKDEELTTAVQTGEDSASKSI